MSIKDRFQAEINKPDEQINLAYAALLFAEYIGQPFEVEPYLNKLDQLAESAQRLLPDTLDDTETLELFNDYIFGELGFQGDDIEYYNPHNSFLNKVLDNGRGIPISLSVIYLEIGWRLGLPMWGISLPRHFIIGYGQTDCPVYVDVFNQGRLLNEDDCLTIAQIPFNRWRTYGRTMLRPVDKGAIVYRMLLNLKYIYVQQEQWQLAYNVVDLMLLLPTKQPDDLRDRGLIASRLDRFQDAVFDLERYLFLSPKSDTDDLQKLRRQVDEMEQKILRLN